MGQASFDEYTKEEIARLEGEIKSIKEQMDPLIDQLERNRIKLKHLQNYLNVTIREDFNSVDNSPRHRLLRKNFSRSETVEAMAIRILERFGAPMHYGEILKRMDMEEGRPISGKNPRANMSAHLSNSDRIIGIGDGMYKLKKWDNDNKRLNILNE